MFATHIDLLHCPMCEGKLCAENWNGTNSSIIKEGVAFCSGCGEVYPIEDGVLDLLTGDLIYGEFRKAFWHRHSDRLAKRIPSVASGNIDGSPSAQKQQQEHSDWFADNDKITYSAFSDTPFWRSVDKSIFNTWRTILAGTGERLIDVGCAQGRATFVFADLDLDILAFDVSRSLVCQAARRAHHERHRARISFFLADALKMPVSSAAFDGALVYGVLHHLPNPGEVCREIQRVLRPGGWYFGSENNISVFRVLFDMLMHLVPLWKEEAGVEALISEKRLREWFDSGMEEIIINTSVYLPPHVINFLGDRFGGSLLSLMDRIASRIPFLCHQGGLISARMRKLR